MSSKGTPQEFGEYHLLEKIATGGMAEVWRARAYGMAGFEKILVIKKVLKALGRDEEFITLFIDEAKIAVQLLHVNIVQVFDLGQVDGTYYMARVRQEDGELAWTSPIWHRPPQTEVVSDQVLLDRERMVLLAYAAVMRAWPDLPTKDLGWKSPREARSDPEWSERFDELWVQFLATAEELERLGLEAGMTRLSDQVRELLGLEPGA